MVESDSANGYYNYSYTYTDNTTWVFDNAVDSQPYMPWRPNEDERTKKIEEWVKSRKKKKIKIEGVDIMTLYDVYLVYAENRKSPIVIPMFGVIARDEEDAKIKSGLMKKVEDDWDADYLNFIVKEIGEVKVKEKPKEVKQV